MNFRLICVFLCLALVCCKQRGASGLSYVGYEYAPSSLNQSIGAFVTDDGASQGFGSAAIIGENESYYFGITNAHVWNAYEHSFKEKGRVAFRGDDSAKSWIAFEPELVVEDKTRLITRTGSERSKDNLGLDLAVFRLKKDSRRLSPLKVFLGELPSKPYSACVFGYPGDVTHTGRFQSEVILTRSKGVSFRLLQNKKYAEQLSKVVQLKEGALVVTSHLVGGNSGSPIMDCENPTTVYGLAAATRSSIDKTIAVGSERSAAKDIFGGNYGVGWSIDVLRKRFPDTKLWGNVNVATVGDFKFTKGLTELIEVNKSKVGDVVLDGEVNYLFNLKLKDGIDISPYKIFINGLPSSKYTEFSASNQALLFEVAKADYTSPMNHASLHLVSPKQGSSEVYGVCNKGINDDLECDSRDREERTLNNDRMLLEFYYNQN